MTAAKPTKKALRLAARWPLYRHPGALEYANTASPNRAVQNAVVPESSQINSISRTPHGRHVPVALIRLVVYPLPVAALPSASNVAQLAERFGADDTRIAA